MSFSTLMINSMQLSQHPVPEKWEAAVFPGTGAGELDCSCSWRYNGQDSIGWWLVGKGPKEGEGSAVFFFIRS